MLTAVDATYVISGAMYWSVIEINVGILAASIPSFKPIASRYAPRLLGSSYNRSRSGGKGGVGGQYHHGSSYLKSSGLGRSKNGTMELRSVERGDRFGCKFLHDYISRYSRTNTRYSAKWRQQNRGWKGIRHWHGSQCS